MTDDILPAQDYRKMKNSCCAFSFPFIFHEFFDDDSIILQSFCSMQGRKMNSVGEEASSDRHPDLIFVMTLQTQKIGSAK
jgi:hypothetical protein